MIRERIERSAAAVVCFGLWPLTASAANLAVRVVDSQGQAVEQVVVSADPVDASLAPARPKTPQHAVMDQIDTEFVPHILVIPTGTEVDFPNNDTVSHHVYSFSAAKQFELELYKGSVYPPVTFDKPGLVVLGCNIHDSMLGYILVLDSPYFQMTNADGVAELEGLAPGTYEIKIWTPRAKSKELPAPIRTTASDAGEDSVQIQFTEKLRPPHSSDDGALVWSHY